jgi:ubiquinone/menaquinone biosynthesis C-methylase UbiE
MNLPDIGIKELNHLLGNIDIYLLDQILKARFPKKGKILDAGCGEGRNLVYFIRNNYQVFGIDKNEDSIQMLKYLATSVNPSYPADRFTVGNINDLPYKDHAFDAVISSAVLHFAESKTEFLQQLSELSRVLKKGGLLFLRMATLLGMEDKVEPLENGKYLLPDGSVRFLLTRNLLGVLEDKMEYVEPLKVILVDQQRCMSTLVLKKRS